MDREKFLRFEQLHDLNDIDLSLVFKLGCDDLKCASTLWELDIDECLTKAEYLAFPLASMLLGLKRQLDSINK